MRDREFPIDVTIRGFFYVVQRGKFAIEGARRYFHGASIFELRVLLWKFAINV